MLVTLTIYRIFTVLVTLTVYRIYILQFRHHSVTDNYIWSYFNTFLQQCHIPREHYRQHCQYRLRGLMYIARGQVSSIINLGNIRRHLDIARDQSTTFPIQGPKVYCAWPGIEHNKEDHAHFQQMAPHS